MKKEKTPAPHRHRWGRISHNAMGYPVRRCPCGAAQIKTDGRWRYLATT